MRFSRFKQHAEGLKATPSRARATAPAKPAERRRAKMGVRARRKKGDSFKDAQEEGNEERDAQEEGEGEGEASSGGELDGGGGVKREAGSSVGDRGVGVKAEPGGEPGNGNYGYATIACMGVGGPYAAEVSAYGSPYPEFENAGAGMGLGGYVKAEEM